MTDERYSYVEDVKNRKNVARSGGKKGKSRYGCSLPVDYMTTKEKRDANSRWISVTYDRPISFDKFLAYSDEDKKKYLQTLIDRYAGDTGKIAKMFGCTEAKIKVFRQNLGVVYNIERQSDEIMWDVFLTFDEFLRKPMSSDTFKTMDYYDQTQYIGFLVETMGASMEQISSELFDQSRGNLRLYLKNHNISYYHRGKGYRMSEEKLKAWGEWLGKDDKPEQKTEERPLAPSKEIPMDTPDEKIQMVEEPNETESDVIPSMQAHFRIDSQDYEYLTKINGPALLKKVRIAALEEMIEVYEDALNSGGDTKLRIFVQKPKGVTNTSFQIPPDYLQDFFTVMRKQLEILKNEKKREEESDEKEKAWA